MTTDGRLITASAGTLIYGVDNPHIGRIDISVLDPDADLNLVHAWVTARAATFWGLSAHSRDELREIYAYVDSLPSHHAYLVRRDGIPVVLLQTYLPENDPVGDRYLPLPGDVGMHLLLGDRGAPVRRFTSHLGAEIGRFLFTPPHARRIVVEPDVRNDRAIARVRQMGFEFGEEIELEGKTARLAFLTRDRWSQFAHDLAHRV